MAALLRTSKYAISSLIKHNACIRAVRLASAQAFDPVTWTPADAPLHNLTDGQVLELVDSRKIPLHALEHQLKDASRAVAIRRAYMSRALVSDGISAQGEDALANLPSKDFDQHAFYSSIEGTNCEAVVGFVLVWSV
jgi:hypothetical protein